jgi:hypothetical protein
METYKNCSKERIKILFFKHSQLLKIELLEGPEVSFGLSGRF